MTYCVFLFMRTKRSGQPRFYQGRAILFSARFGDGRHVKSVCFWSYSNGASNVPRVLLSSLQFTIFRGEALAGFRAGLLSWSNWNLDMLVFVEGGTGELGEKSSEQGENQQQTQPTHGT